MGRLHMGFERDVINNNLVNLWSPRDSCVKASTKTSKKTWKSALDPLKTLCLHLNYLLAARENNVEWVVYCIFQFIANYSRIATKWTFSTETLTWKDVFNEMETFRHQFNCSKFWSYGLCEKASVFTIVPIEQGALKAPNIPHKTQERRTLRNRLL